MASDADLLRKAQSGNIASLDELLARHERQVFRFGLRMCGNEDDAKDVLQETLLAAFRNIDGFRGDAQLSTWLYQIARSFCMRARRRTAGEPEQTEPLDAPAAARVPSAEAQPDAKAHAREMGQLLQAAILALPVAYREALVLRDVEGLSAEEAAKVVGIEVGALKSRLHRARMELRERLGDVLSSGAPQAACPDLAEELAAYATEDIDQAACARIEDHLSRCRNCSAACDSLKRTVSFCKQIPGDEVPAPVRAAIRAALLAASSPR
ncbi:MAG TPA: sigma-70 family RNA polymerase sigma factor [Myxococcales bacterium]|nr:sigma-70 family RNA polymerase sigma factor [Myxococcales bacterium]